VTVKKEGPSKFVIHFQHFLSRKNLGIMASFFECVTVKADKKIKTIAVGKILYEAPDGQKKHKI